MQIFTNSIYKQTKIQLRSIYLGILTIGSALTFLFLFFIGQVHIAFAVLIFSIILLSYLYSPPLGIMVLLGASTITGILNRLALHLTGSSASADFVRFAIEILIILFGLRLLITQPVKNNKYSRYVDLSIIGYFIISSIYTFNLFYVGPAITLWGWRWTCLPIIMYFLGRRLGYYQDYLRLFFNTIIILLLVLSSYAIYQAAVGLPSFEKLWFNLIPAAEKASAIIEGSMFIAGKPRLPSMTANHVSFTLLSGYLFILIVYVPKKYLSKYFRMIRLAALLSTIIYLVLTLERSAIAMILVGFVSVLFLSFRRKIGRISWILIISVVIISFLFMSFIDISSIPWTQETIALRRIVELTNIFQANTVRGRALSIWPIAFERMKENPFGYGLGTFHTTSQNQALGYKFFIPPHNMYFQIALEIGIFGLLVFIFFVFSYSKLLINAFISGKDKKLIQGAFASLASILAVAFFNYPLEPPIAFFFWIFTGLSVSYFIFDRLKPGWQINFE